MGKIVSGMPKNGKVISYGLLSEKPMENIPAIALIARNISVEGFLLPNWLKK